MIILSTVKILLFSDTHLGFDCPVRPRVKRRRRGEDFFANYQRVLDYARVRKVDLVVHGGDLFFRARIPAKIVDMAYTPLIEFADEGIPIVLVPGNHERSNLPPSLFLGHPSIHVTGRPESIRFDFAASVAVSGFPCVRKDIRDSFADVVEETGWKNKPADIRLLCLHQAVEGARVGPSGYAFRHGHDVIRMKDIPPEFDAVLAGHIHRAQILRRAGRPPVIYPGSTERTSFAEMDERKGFYLITFSENGDAWKLEEPEFVELPARPMIDIWLGKELTSRTLEGHIRESLSDCPADSIVRFRNRPDLKMNVRRMMTADFLRRAMPREFDYRFSFGFFDPDREASRGGEEPREKVNREETIREEASNDELTRTDIERVDSNEGLTTRIRTEVEDIPGVYAFLDGDGDVIYVGKSVALKRRMLSYFSASAAPVDRPAKLVAGAATDFRIWQTVSEFEALIFEDVQIKRYRPRMNVRQNELEQYVYLRFTDDKYPAMKITPAQTARGDEVYGPFRDRYFAERIKRLLSELFGLRVCESPDTEGGCMNRDIDLCVGPCTGGKAGSEYEKIVQKADRFLRGDTETALQILEAKMRYYAERCRFEEAASIRDMISLCRKFGSREKFISDFTTRRLTISDDETGKQYEFDRGIMLSPICGLSDQDPSGPDSEKNTEIGIRFVDRAIIIKALLDREPRRYKARFE